MSRLYLVIFLALSGLWVTPGRAETYKLITGETVVGDIMTSTANDLGMQIKVGEGEYQKVSWGNFAQEDLKKFSSVPKLANFVEPFIEITRQERAKQTEAPIKPVPHLTRPAAQSLVGAFFSSGLGLVIVLIFYAANLYAGYEIAACRGRPRNTVMAVSAVLPMIGPIIFLSMPTKMLSLADEKAEEVEETPPPANPAQAAPNATAAPVAPGATASSLPSAPAVAPATPPPAATPPRTAPPAHRDTPRKLAVPHQTPSLPSAGEQPVPLDDTSHILRKDLPRPILFQRGQFTFNRRFFETKFAGFMGVVPKEAERGMVLVIKSLRGEYTGSRISRLTPSELYLQVDREQVSEEVMIPFQEVREIVMKHKDG